VLLCASKKLKTEESNRSSPSITTSLARSIKPITDIKNRKQAIASFIDISLKMLKG
jgi:hypothetical protein